MIFKNMLEVPALIPAQFPYKLFCVWRKMLKKNKQFMIYANASIQASYLNTKVLSRILNMYHLHTICEAEIHLRSKRYDKTYWRPTNRSMWQTHLCVATKISMVHNTLATSYQKYDHFAWIQNNIIMQWDYAKKADWILDMYGHRSSPHNQKSV